MTRVLLHTEIKRIKNKQNAEEEITIYKPSTVQIYSSVIIGQQSLGRRRMGRDRQHVRKTGRDRLRCDKWLRESKRGEGKKRGVVSPCVQAGAAN